MSVHDDESAAAPGGPHELSPEVLEALALGLSPLSPPSGLRKRLFDRVGGSDRFLPFLDRMMSLFDLPEGETRERLADIDRPDVWDDLAEGARFFDFDGGPAIGDAHGGMVRVEPGHVFPYHTHVGEERVLLLQGEVLDDAGRRWRAGDVIVSADGTGHELRAVGDKAAIYAAVVIALEFPAADDDDDDD